jgi:uncharacterized protein (DUF2062 family)
LNKAITLVASNISIPPMVPLILCGGLTLGHWLFTGEVVALSPSQMTRAKALEYFWQWFVGSVALAVFVGAAGALLTYLAARLVRRK